MPRRHVASDGLTENFRDSPTRHRAGHSRGRQPPAGLSSGPDDPGWSCRSNGDPGGTRRKLSFRAAQRVVEPLFNPPIQFDRLLQAFHISLVAGPSRLRDPQSPSLPKRTIAAGPAHSMIGDSVERGFKRGRHPRERQSPGMAQVIPPLRANELDPAAPSNIVS